MYFSLSPQSKVVFYVKPDFTTVLSRKQSKGTVINYDRDGGGSIAAGV